MPISCISFLSSKIILGIMYHRDYFHTHIIREHSYIRLSLLEKSLFSNVTVQRSPGWSRWQLLHPADPVPTSVSDRLTEGFFLPIGSVKSKPKKFTFKDLFYVCMNWNILEFGKGACFEICKVFVEMSHNFPVLNYVLSSCYFSINFENIFLKSVLFSISGITFLFSSLFR